ncbi:MAG: PQQ-dependent sugar dehydrogenase [Planktomarina sp.]
MRKFLFVILMVCGAPLWAQIPSSQGELDPKAVVTGLDEPWAFAFLPSGAILVTERNGRLIYANDGTVRFVSNLPDIMVDGQGGLLDVMIPRDYAQSREILFTYAKPQGLDSGTAIAKAVFDEANMRLENVETLFELTPGSSGGRHFGSRLIEGRDGYIYATIGDRGDRPSAQDLSNENGSVIRIARDGSIPSDNPFSESAIWSYGHRNAQGLAMDGQGRIWGVEHGARGGDEVNLIEKGANYGWPIISYGTHYSGEKIGVGTAQDGLEQPAFYWDPSIAPSGAAFLTNDGFKGWNGMLAVGSLKFDAIYLLDMRNKARQIEILQGPQTDRVRDVREGPKGGLWFLSVGNGTLYQISPMP